ncbi:hypothetical protein J4466_03895 [Candidatus Pacearchaeota archaeon]|nr:hypothetical protein [Candidatus Pacearchaeota archaeon]
MNLQQVIINYTKLLAKRLYGVENLKVNFDICFDDYSNDEGIFSGECNSKEKIITYNSLSYKKDRLSFNVWDTMVHEVTHLKYFGHNLQFIKEFEINLRLVDDLRKEFNKEVGWDEDFEYEENDIDERVIEDNVYCELFKIEEIYDDDF